MKLDELSKLKIINADLAFKLAEKEEVLQRVILIATVQELDPTKRIERVEREIAAACERKTALFADYQKLLAEASKTLGFDIKDYMINNETGELIKIFNTNSDV